MADTTVKLSGTYDSIEAYELLEEMRSVASSYLPLTGGEISGDLIVDGQLSGNLTGNVTGTASGNLPLSGGTMTGPLILSDGGTALSDAKVACGSVTNWSATANSVTVQVVTFDVPFASAPIVTATMTGMSSGGVDNPAKLQIYTNSVSTTGFTVRIYNSGTATYNIAVHWIAIQP